MCVCASCNIERAPEPAGLSKDILPLLGNGEARANGVPVIRLAQAISSVVRPLTNYFFFAAPQANEVRQFLAKNKDDSLHGDTIKLMLGESDKPSMMVTSNLRRAISTGVISVWDRLSKNIGEKVQQCARARVGACVRKRRGARGGGGG